MDTAPAPAIARPEPGLRRILAPNPSPMTQRGTNTYLLGEGEVAVIDPGPALPAHLDAILGALGPHERVSHILVTHAHLDHSPLARPLAEATGAPVLAFGPATLGRSALMERLAGTGQLGGGEGLDRAFAPDARLGHGDRLTGGDWALEVLHTPGHLPGHLCLKWNDAAFSGDHVMGWASTMVSPPDGDMGDYMRALDTLGASGAQRLYPGHGEVVPDAPARIDALRRHRLEREGEILARLAEGPSDAETLARRIYTETPPALMAAARRSVLAHLIDLTERSRAAPLSSLSALSGQSRFRAL